MSRGPFDMADSRCGQSITVESEWLAVNDVEAFLASWPVDRPVNIVGNHAGELAARLASRAPSLRTTAIGARPSRNISIDPGGDNDPMVAGDRLADAIIPRANTVILDPILGQWLIDNPDILESVALKTFDSLLIPVFVEPLDWIALYSDEFSFEEPADDDLTIHRWCWCVSEKPATVFIQSREPLLDHRLKFAITCASPGTVVCRVGDTVQAHTIHAENLTSHFSFIVRQHSPHLKVDITFEGTPLPPASPSDQRGFLYFNYSNAAIESAAPKCLGPSAVSAPSGVKALTDRSVRRVLHAHGFFEVRSLSTPWAGLAALSGVRSCYDYQCGFSYRDADPGSATAFGGIGAMHYGFPAIWYQARRMPSPGIEWVRTRERFVAAAAAV